MGHDPSTNVYGGPYAGYGAVPRPVSGEDFTRLAVAMERNNHLREMETWAKATAWETSQHLMQQQQAALPQPHYAELPVAAPRRGMSTAAKVTLCIIGAFVALPYLALLLGAWTGSLH